MFAAHIKGTFNVLADALSRNKAAYFVHSHPQANPLPTLIPPEVLDLLIVKKPVWRSVNWTRLWTSIFGKV